MMEVYHRIVSLEKEFSDDTLVFRVFLVFGVVFGVFGMCGKGNLADYCDVWIGLEGFV